jgi:cystathionine beta-lyase/cystathionine gamma-synthase
MGAAIFAIFFLLYFILRAAKGRIKLNPDYGHLIYHKRTRERIGSNYFNAVAPPIVQTSNFRVNKVDQLRALFEDEYSGYLYSRGLNPTVEILRKKLAALDGAEDCLVLQQWRFRDLCRRVLANVKAGDHIVSVSRPYTWAQRLFDVILPRFGVTTTYVDGTRIENFERAILPATSLIYLESPNSWDYKLQDLQRYRRAGPGGGDRNDHR